MRPVEARHDADGNPIAAIRQYPMVVLLFAVLFGGIGAVFALSQPPAFSAQAGIVVEDARASTLFNSRSSDAERYVADQVAILESRVVAESASGLAAEEDPPLEITVDDFLANTTISSSAESNFITISFVASSAARAQAGADAIGRSYEQVIQAALAEDAQTAVAELDTAIAAAVREIETLQGEIEALRTDNQERAQLDDQLAQLVTALVALREESQTLQDEGIDVPPGDDTTEEEALRTATADISVRISQLSEELRARLLVSDVEARVPATAFLLQQQEDAATRLSELTLRRSQIEVDARLAGNGVAFLAPAGPGRERGVPTSSTVVLLTAVGALVGAGVAYWLSQRRQYVTHRLAPQGILDAPLLAEVPALSRAELDRIRQASDGDGAADPVFLPVLHDAASPRAEAFRVLVGALTRRLEEARTRSDAAEPGSAHRGMIVAICSPLIGDGKTLVAANTALAASRAGLRVALIDGDFGAQDASGLLSPVPPRARPMGLTEVVQDGIRIEDAMASVDPGRAGGSLDLMGRGYGEIAAPDLFASPATGRVLEQTAARYDLVLIDLPPLLQVAYASTAAQKAGQALIVVRHDSLLDDLRELRHRLDVIGVEAMGYVLTEAPSRRGSTAPVGPSGDVLGKVST